MNMAPGVNALKENNFDKDDGCGGISPKIKIIFRNKCDVNLLKYEKSQPNSKLELN